MNHQQVISVHDGVCRLPGQERCDFWWVPDLALLLLLPFGLSLLLFLSLTPSGPPLPPPPAILSGVTVTDPSGTAYPGIPEQLFGSSASVLLRPRDERGSGKTFFFFSSFQHNRELLFPPALCSFVPLIVSTHGSHVCSFDSERRLWHLLAHKPFCLRLKQEDRNNLFARIIISK